MLRICFFVCFLLVSGATISQGQNVVGQKSLAPFEIQLTNGALFKKSDLKPGPVILIYFSPDCGHCKDFTKELLKYPDAIASKQVVMVTFTPLPTVQQFERTMFLSMFPNIKAGTEGESYRVVKHYGIRSFPYIALYDKKGSWVKSYEGEQPFKDILKSIKGL